MISISAENVAQWGKRISIRYPILRNKLKLKRKHFRVPTNRGGRAQRHHNAGPKMGKTSRPLGKTQCSGNLCVAMRPKDQSIVCDVPDRIRLCEPRTRTGRAHQAYESWSLAVVVHRIVGRRYRVLSVSREADALLADAPRKWNDPVIVIDIIRGAHFIQTLGAIPVMSCREG
ncbi:hypothetical protein BC826DRAFT_598547 [Russula brevipes]|nr:hypothetical protein BC826DRAFT_598547 [Russula brevipes]